MAERLEQIFQKYQWLQYFFKGLPMSMAGSFRQVLQTYSEICFFVVRFNIQCPRNSHWEVLEVQMKYWQNLWKLSLMMKLILQLICIISSNPQPSPGTPFPQMSHFSLHTPKQNNFQNSSLLDTSETALVCIFSSISNHRQENQKSSIIKD